MFPPFYIDFFRSSTKKIGSVHLKYFLQVLKSTDHLVPIEPWFQAPRWISLRSTVIARERLDPWVSSGRPWRIPMGKMGIFYPPFCCWIFMVHVGGYTMYIYIYIMVHVGLRRLRRAGHFESGRMNKVWPTLLIAEFWVVFLCSLWLCKHCLWQMTTSSCCCVCCCMDTVTRSQWFDHAVFLGQRVRLFT